MRSGEQVWQASKHGWPRSRSSSHARRVRRRARMVLVQANATSASRRGCRLSRRRQTVRARGRGVPRRTLQHVIVNAMTSGRRLSLVRDTTRAAGLCRRRSGIERLSPREALRISGIVSGRDGCESRTPRGNDSKVIPEAYVADTFDQAMAMSRETPRPLPRSMATSSAVRTSSRAARRSSRAAFLPPSARSRSCASAWPATARTWCAWPKR